MRKKLSILIVILLLPFLLFSSSSIKALSRGDAVLTSNRAEYSFTHNPAFLTSSDFSIHFSVNASLNSTSNILSKDLEKDIGDLTSGDFQRMFNGALNLLNGFSGTMPFATLNESISFTLDGFGMNLALKEGIMSRGGSIGIELSAYVNAELGFGVGWDYGNEDYSIAFGIAPKFIYTLETRYLGLEQIIDFLIGDSVLNILDLYHGITAGADIGIYLKFPYGISSALVFKDIYFPYRVENVNGDTKEEYTQFSLNGAIGWKGEWGIISLDIELGLKGLNMLRNTQDLMKSFNAGASLGITRYLTLSAGLRSGYPSFGFDLDFYALNIACAYYYEDYGVIYGLNPRDVLALEITIGWDSAKK